MISDQAYTRESPTAKRSTKRSGSASFAEPANTFVSSAQATRSNCAGKECALCPTLRARVIDMIQPYQKDALWCRAPSEAWRRLRGRSSRHDRPTPAVTDTSTWHTSACDLDRLERACCMRSLALSRHASIWLRRRSNTDTSMRDCRCSLTAARPTWWAACSGTMHNIVFEFGRDHRHVYAPKRKLLVMTCS